MSGVRSDLDCESLGHQTKMFWALTWLVDSHSWFLDKDGHSNILTKTIF